jgi:hypothetical protein
MRLNFGVRRRDPTHLYLGGLMLIWIFPLLLVCWLAAMLLERRVRRCAIELSSPAREQLATIVGQSFAPERLRKAILRRHLRAVPDAQFLRVCALYRACMILYIIFAALTVVALALTILAL